MSTAARDEKPKLTIEDLRGRLSINVQDAADLLGIGRATAYDAVRRGEIPALRVGRRLLVPTGTLLRLLGREP